MGVFFVSFVFGVFFFNLSTCGFDNQKSRRTKTFPSSDLMEPLNMSKQILSTPVLLQLQSDNVLNNCLGSDSVSQRYTTESGVLLLLWSHVSNTSASMFV